MVIRLLPAACLTRTRVRAIGALSLESLRNVTVCARVNDNSPQDEDRHSLRARPLHVRSRSSTLTEDKTPENTPTASRRGHRARGCTTPLTSTPHVHPSHRIECARSLSQTGTIVNRIAPRPRANRPANTMLTLVLSPSHLTCDSVRQCSCVSQSPRDRARFDRPAWH